MANITKKITYNLAERGRVHTGQDRSNVDISSMVAVINSPFVQELVKTGDMYGYVGHEVRQLYGMNPPDTIISDDGREIRIAPAVRTVFLHADNDGNITHQQEFLDNSAGAYAYEQYKAKIGGFSSAITFALSMHGKRVVNGFNGFDYVKSPNYATNTSYGLFDNTGGGHGDEILKQAIINQYDHIGELMNAYNMADFYQKEALNAQKAVDNHIRRQALRQARQDEILDSMICPTVPLDEFLENGFDGVPVNMEFLNEKPKAQEPKRMPFKGFFGI